MLLWDSLSASLALTCIVHTELLSLHLPFNMICAFYNKLQRFDCFVKHSICFHRKWSVLTRSFKESVIIIISKNFMNQFRLVVMLLVSLPATCLLLSEASDAKA